MVNSNSQFNLTPKQIQRVLLINGDYNVLLDRFSKGDKAALLQIVMLEMPNLISIATTHQVQHVNSEDLIRHITNELIKFIDEQVELLKTGKLEKRWHQNFNRVYNGAAIAYFLNEKLFDKKNELDLSASIPILNRLNDLLAETEREILSTIKKGIEIYKQFKNHNTCHATIEINYYTNDKDGIPAYFYKSTIKIQDDTLDKDWNHWKEEVKYLPKLNNPYCLLLHDLLNNSTIGSNLADIYQYSVEISFSELNFTDLREHEKKEEIIPQKIIVTLGEDGRETITKE